MSCQALDVWRERERANVLAALREAKNRISGKGGAAELLGINLGLVFDELCQSHAG